MATIVLHKPSGEKYIFLGTGFGAYKATRASVLGGDLFPHEEAGEIMAAAVCDAQGHIRWFETEELQVLEMDGVSIDRLYEPLAKEESSLKSEGAAIRMDEQCPACLARVRAADRECPSCGLTLILEE
ncbi:MULTISPECIES: hypothetical protein [unclassified Paenibacillus]|uniref:hypothetical protein n=1 Tax=unclassified Paenibacillus TaxID=185978 RepID=UPI001AE6BA03|nr:MULTISPECIES: hypothetical protein [unclassified Paenibacillus]MBP1153814.1 hypothetical protein [Paenibacillus sp. PvP091]MBP1170801.1 hypothetical protein [Paenibacillus sp. PvR098]MBP2441829.1 hypothetical protein [Paenibacillus sp. PvP052]